MDTQQRNWWRAPEGVDIHETLTGYVNLLEQWSSTLYWLDKIHWAMYENRIMSEGGKYGDALVALRQHGLSHADLRVATSIVDTYIGKVGKNRPAIKINPSDAEWSYKRKGKQLQRWIRGKNEELNAQEIAPLIVLDSAVTGTGIVKVGVEFGEMVLDRVPRAELFVDEREAKYGKPRQIHQKRVCAREVLAEMFPKHRAEIADTAVADPSPDDELEWMDVAESEMVSVYESWHLPSGPDATDGRHAICVENATLLLEEWNRPRLPFAILRYGIRPRGFWGSGLVEQVSELQYVINRTVRDIQKALHWGAQVKVLLQHGSEIVKSHLGRTPRPAVIEYKGRPPEWSAPNPVSKDQVQFLKDCIEWAYNFTGVSQLSAQAKNPLGANASGIALQEFYDLESERLSPQEQRQARWWVDLAEIEIDTAREIALSDSSYSAKWEKRSLMQRIPWKDVDMKRDTYKLTLEPTNFLPDTRAGKLEAASQLAQNGLVDNMLGLFDFPDLERANRLKLAPRRHLERVMEDLGNLEVPFEDIQPEPMMDLNLGVAMVKAEYAIACEENAPEEVKQRFRDWALAAERLLELAQPPMPMQGVPSEGEMPTTPDRAELAAPAPAMPQPMEMSI